MKFKTGNKVAKGGARANSGPTPQAIRQACAEAFAKRIPILCELADDKKLDGKTRILALKELARVGIPMQAEHTGKDGAPITIQAAQLNKALEDPDTAKLANNLARRMAIQPGSNGESAN